MSAPWVHYYAIWQSDLSDAIPACAAWTLVAPATLWSSQVLQLRGDIPKNDFEGKAVLAYLRRCGVPAAVTTRFDKGGTQVTHEIRWPKFAVDIVAS